VEQVEEVLQLPIQELLTLEVEVVEQELQLEQEVLE